MAAKRSKKKGEVVDYRHKTSSRLNIPPAGIAARGKIVKEKKIEYAYNPHLSPSLRFDGTGGSDRIVELLAAATQRTLTDDEAKLLQEAFRNHEPWLEWAGKHEELTCVADPVALHMHERVSTQAILRVAKRENVQRDLFADPEHDYREAVQFYRWPMEWTNRMILGDSLAVMASLSRREAMAGKVQMIYMDPPYGIKYASNFQPEVGRRDVKDRDEDLTREPEMIKAYRDTWTLGVHSYLSYLRDRFTVSKELLSDTGSIFVQIGEDNLHIVRSMLDEVFGADNFVAQIQFKKTGGFDTTRLATICDYLLWFAKSKPRMKFNCLFGPKEYGEGSGERYSSVYMPDGRSVPASQFENPEGLELPSGARLFLGGPVTSDGAAKALRSFDFEGRTLNHKANQHWKTTPEGLARLSSAERLFSTRNFVNYRLFLDDFAAAPLHNMWTDTMGTAERDKAYVVQTTTRIIERCMLMTTDPGDLVLDPTCGSGTTAYVAENWGRRWITLDVSRVALAIARQRLLTAQFDFYKLRPTSAQDVHRNPNGPWLTDPGGDIQGTATFECKTVPHITLKSIAQNPALDPIFAKWAAVLDEKLAALNSALGKVPKDARQKLGLKLMQKEKTVGKRAVTDADRRRWQFPAKEWQHWEVPFDTDPDWPKALRDALEDYRRTWREKMDEVNACIAARADQEELVDQPEVDRGKVRVSGPFTMEGIIPAEASVGEECGETPIGGAPESLDTFEDEDEPIETDSQNAEAYLDRMIRLLREDGVRFPNNKTVQFKTLEPVTDGSILHADGTWATDGKERQVAVMIGPQYGALNALMVEDAIGRARRGGYDDLVFAAFSFEGAAQGLIQEDPDPKLRIHMAQIRPDVNMGDLLKTTTSSQLFTVSGMPRTELKSERDGSYVVEMQGVDIYDPVTNSVRSAGAQKVAAWFLDSDYDGRCFCITQAFFPDKTAWAKLGKALSGTLDEAAFEKLSGTVSLPFPAGPHKRVAVKVIDPRGNEVMRVHRLGETTYDE